MSVWTAYRRWQLMDYIERGLNDDEIAAKLNCTRTAIRGARERYRIASRRQILLTCFSASKRMGLHERTVKRFIMRGWLDARVLDEKTIRKSYIIDPDNLLAFMERPEHWRFWDPARISDSALREWAIELRNSHAD